MQICGKQALVEGKLVRVARLDAEGYDFFDDPELALEAIRKSGAGADLFTFTQKLSDTSPKYSYPMEWDNFAALRVTTFDDWMTKQIDFKARNKASRKFPSTMSWLRESRLSMTKRQCGKESLSGTIGKILQPCEV
jgi:hypothetical protein